MHDPIIQFILKFLILIFNIINTKDFALLAASLWIMRVLSQIKRTHDRVESIEELLEARFSPRPELDDEYY